MDERVVSGIFNVIPFSHDISGVVKRTLRGQFTSHRMRMFLPFFFFGIFFSEKNLTMSKAAIGKALDSLDIQHVCDYLERVHNITIDAKGKRKRPSKQQVKERIYQMENVTLVLCDFERMQHLKHGVKPTTPARKKMLKTQRTLKEGNDEDGDEDSDEDGDEDSDEDDDDDDNVMATLKAELALRGKTTNGTSYRLLVKRLLNSLRDEANDEADE